MRFAFALRRSCHEVTDEVQARSGVKKYRPSQFKKIPSQHCAERGIFYSNHFSSNAFRSSGVSHILMKPVVSTLFKITSSGSGSLK